MKTTIVIAYLFLSLLGHSQNTISIDSLKNYLVEDSILSRLTVKNQYLEVKNTSLGIVLYEPSNTLLKVSNTHDTIVELDGFEFYDWIVNSVDTMIDGSIQVTGNCPAAWGKARAVFNFKYLNTNPELFLLSRAIYDENDIQILYYEKVIIEKILIKKLVCLREPNPYIPGTELPFIKLELDNLSFASKQKNGKMTK